MAGIVSYVMKHRPKQSEIAADLRLRIISGEYPPGSQLPPVTALQERYGVTPVTVRRAVKYLCERGLLFTREREGIFVAPDPPCLCNIGLVRPYMWCPSQFVAAVENELKRLCRTTTSLFGTSRRFTAFDEVECPPERAERVHRELVSAVEAETVAGLVFLRPPDRFAGTAIMRAPAMPRVAINDDPIPGVAVIQVDCFYDRALRYLARRGRRRVAVITITARADSWMPDVVGQVRAHGFIIHDWWVQAVPPNDVRWARNAAGLLLRANGPDRPDAVIIDDDNLVPSATAGIAATGLRVPDDVDVVAHTNFPWPTQSAVPVVRVGTDTRRLVITAVDLIETMRSGEEVPEVVEIQACFEEEALPADDGSPNEAGTMTTSTRTFVNNVPGEN